MLLCTANTAWFHLQRLQMSLVEGSRSLVREHVLLIENHDQAAKLQCFQRPFHWLSRNHLVMIYFVPLTTGVPA